MKKKDTRQNQKNHKTFDTAMEVVSNIAIVVVTFLVFYICSVYQSSFRNMYVKIVGNIIYII